MNMSFDSNNLLMIKYGGNFMMLSLDLTSSIIFAIVGLLVGLIIAFGVVYFIYHTKVKKDALFLTKGQKEAETLVKNATEEAAKIKDLALKEGKAEVLSLRQEVENELKQRKMEITEQENKLEIREDSLDRRSNSLDRREELLNDKETRLDSRKNELEKQSNEIEEVLKQQLAKLEEIAQMKQEDAKKIIFEEVKEKVSLEIAEYVKDEEEKARAEVKNKAKNILALAIQKYAGETASETTAATVALPIDEMKGRIIGREGRNIRAIESLTGVDLIIDDTPEAVVLSSFDPIRREVAKKALEILVSDGRIHPSRIEEVVERCRNEIEMDIREKGEEAVFETGIGKIHPDLVKLLGRLYYRTSYGQNVLKHSIETAMLAGKLASEIGENEILARRAGLLHDIGKACDHEVEGSHVEIGVELATKYHEAKEVIDAIASHHEDQAPKSIIAVLVQAADALSSARPGARSDSLENYVKRLEALETISNSVDGVSESYAVQAGREIRVIVKPDQINDLETISVARKIKEEIENKLSYPGTIKVTVIRETRAVDVAK